MTIEQIQPMADEMADRREQLNDTLRHIEAHPEDKFGLSPFAQDLTDEIAHYDSVVRGEVSAVLFDTLSDIPRILIDARRARHMSRDALADSWRLSEEQKTELLKDEGSFYARTSLAGLITAIRILDIGFRGEASLTQEEEDSPTE